MKSYAIKNGVRPTITTAEEGTIALVAGDKGAIFYNTDTDSLRTWDGTAFQDVGGGGTNDFVATGAIGAGDVVGLRSDGTVEVVQESLSSAVMGTAQTFESAQTEYISSVYDSIDKKVIISYKDLGNSNYGTVIVGTVSGTVITFGTAQVFESATTSYISSVYDSTDKKVIISYSDGGNGSYGTVIIGTVSGTVITFGTAQVFESGPISYASSVYDSIDKKVIISSRAAINSNYGKIIVGTVSGTVITFGTAQLFTNTAMRYISSVYDSTDKKVIISYQDSGNGSYGTVIVGTVSGTVVTFGTAQVFESAQTYDISSVYDSTDKKVIISYSDSGNGSYGTVIIGTVSGTVVTFGTAQLFESGAITYASSVYDSTDKKVIISYSDGGNSSYGTAIAYELPILTTNAISTIGIATAAISDTATGTITVLGGINDQQSALTPGLYYYVDYQGTVTTTPNVAFDYKVLGRAVSATEILVEVDNEFDITDYTITKSQISDFVVNIADLGDALSGSFTLPTGDNEIDFEAYIHFDKTLDSNWVPTFTNPVKGKMITIIATGGTTNTLTLPASVKGDISAFDCTLTNQLQMYCLDDTTPVYSVTLLNW